MNKGVNRGHGVPSSAQSDDAKALSTLIGSRQCLLAKISKLKSELRDAVIELDHLEATMRLFDAKIDFRALGARTELPAHPAQHGEVMRIVLSALVDAGRPLSTASLIEQIISVRGLDRTDPKLRQKLGRRLGPSLRYAERVRGLVRSLPGPGQMNMWELVR